MFGFRRNKPQSTIDSLIGATTVIEGDVVFSGGLRIDGQVRGNVVAADGTAVTNSTLVVSLPSCAPCSWEISSFVNEARVPPSSLMTDIPDSAHVRRF